MENSPLKILLISSDPEMMQRVSDLLRGAASEVDVTVEPTADAGLAMATTNLFHAVVFEIAQANTAALFQISLLTTKAPQLPVIVIGPGEDEGFLAEAVFSGGQDYIGREQLTASLLRHAIHCSISRQQERLALVEEKNNYYGIFDHLVEGIFRTTVHGHYLLANVALARIYGYDSPVELMASIKDIAGSLYVENGRREEFVRLMQENDTISGFESRIYRKDETIIWISENCRAVRDAQGKLLYYEGTVEDITERKHAEEQIRRATAELSRSREELRAKNSQMEDNLRMARETQLTMLPQQYPTFPPNVPPERSAFQFVHRYEAAESVSGDFFSVSTISDTEVAVFICDVTGHGIRAALVTAMIRALVEELKPIAREPGQFLRKLNYDLCNILKNTGSLMLTTAFYAVADSRTGALRYANAGHPKPLMIRRSQSRLEPLANSAGRSQPALGLFEDPPYQTSETAMAPGDFLMLFTDGLYEVQGLNEELYSQERLMLDTKNLLGEPPGVMFDELLNLVRTFAVGSEFDDDVCLVGMSYQGMTEAG
ncbi:MAG TPA: SpoIIE family protein phosphatase [Candidatus Binatia bacterium]|nr:SpoIIE family protein phosphatase [Candidatus Binatia bacterium]